MGFAATSQRPIPGAVATLGVSDRVAFLRRTYGLLGLALIAWPILTAAIFTMAPGVGYKLLIAGGGMGWLIVIGGFMLVSYLANKLAMSESSRGLQLLGLGLEVGAWSILLQPMIWILAIKFGDKNFASLSASGAPVLSAAAYAILMKSVVVTLAIFVGLTLTVFISKKDFTFLGGFLSMCAFAAMGVALASILFGFSLGVIYCGLLVLLMGGYILYQTSVILTRFPPQAYVAAALMLFSTVATLFWYVLQLFMSSSRRN
ncbi:Bax inhibitor-1 family protein [soil metagenome]